ncbi:MAG: (2Fe-2S)-binding protein [Rhodospirillales bacterium]|nr:(2Fe-2S)-binding protein [Rhodospirillales bacterium]MDE2197742.1 (2Fe-2S)-binding protein [Rhodospirillales bacterium]MDE2575132.1 (2Fe-2S)-binding protein [Rhodospirillales bacterium]
MFRRFDKDDTPLEFFFEGRRVTARLGDTVAAALLAGGAGPFRLTPASRAPRAPYCLMGLCFDCLVEIDGVANRQACMVPVASGMRVRRQPGPPSVA